MNARQKTPLRLVPLLVGVCLTLTLGVNSACGTSPEEAAKQRREAEERAGAQQLAVARTHFQQQQYEAARDSILSLRRTHPLAMQARAQGILLLDSIELAMAKADLQQFDAQTPALTSHLDSVHHADAREVLTVKVRFFERKLQEDLAR